MEHHGRRLGRLGGERHIGAPDRCIVGRGVGRQLVADKIGEANALPRRIREKKQRVLPQMQGPLLVGRSVALQKTYLRLERILSVRVARADAACLVGNLPPQVFRAVGAHLQLLTHALQQAMCTICQCASVQRRAVASGSAATVLARSRRNARAQCSPSTTRCSICAAERSILLS
jgi:hypothetical protein